MDFYAYLYLREDGTPYYAGKGSGERAFNKRQHRVSVPSDKSHILIFPQKSEADAFNMEITLIRRFGRVDLGTGCLLNLTNGGQGYTGHFGFKKSQETLRRMRDVNLGHPDYSTAEGIARARATKRTHAYRIAAAEKQRLVWAKRKREYKCRILDPTVSST
jgi:hypothetical protein